MTTVQTEVVGDLAHQYTAELIETKRDIERKFLYLGKLLYEINDQQLYEAYGGSMQEYLAHPDVNIKVATAYNLMKIYKLFVLHYNCEPQLLAEIGITKLVTLAEKIDLNDENVEEWLDKAASLSRRDLLIEAGVSTDVNYDGFISIILAKDEAGLLLNINSAPDNIQTGIYRLRRTEPYGRVERITAMKGRPQLEESQ